MKEDPAKREHINKVLKVVTKVSYADGAYIGGGWIDDPEFKDQDIGIVVVDRLGQQQLGFEMNMQNLLILVQVISITVRMYIEKKVGGILMPVFPKFRK